VEFYSEGNLLSKVNSKNPVWWTATVKAKAVAGIILSLRFAHSFGLIHGHLMSKNIIFDIDHRIQITGFSRLGQEIERTKPDNGRFIGEEWSPDRDVRSFGSILFEIIVGHPEMLCEATNAQEIALHDIPEFVSRLVMSEQSPERRRRESFNDILDIMKQNQFKIMSGVDSVDVLAFVDWVESFEELVK
jgi:serine/threonine protein kinase